MKTVKQMALGGLITAGLLLGAAGPVMATIENVGGGTWNYGTAYQPPFGKKVWSNYVHNSLYHSSTAIGGSQEQKRYAVAHNWSEASVICGAFDSTAAYWATY